MKCEICGNGMQQGVTLHRTGRRGPGENPHWRCESDIPKSFKVDSDVAEIVAIIESSNQERKH